MPHLLFLADDSVTIQRVIELTFADEDVRVVAVGDGQAAIDRVLDERPDIVLADIDMPGRDGYEVAAFVRSQAALGHVPVLLLAGAFEPIDDVRVREAGAAGVLVKPFEPQVLIRRVRELIGARSSDAEAPRPVPEMRLRPDDLSQMDGTPDGIDRSLDDYFDRLDAAFATLDARQTGAASPQPASARDETLPVQGLRIAVADVFSALLAQEQGDPARRRVMAPATIPDQIVEAIVERVLARMSDAVVREVVTDLVSQVAERLVRDEIDRIRRAAE